MKRKKLKNIILKTVAYIMVFLFLVAGCALDSNSWVPYIVCGASLAWLALFAYANKEFIIKEG